MAETECDWCHNKIKKSPNKIKLYKFHFCDNECKEKFRRKRHYYSKTHETEQLQKIIRISKIKGVD